MYNAWHIPEGLSSAFPYSLPYNKWSSPTNSGEEQRIPGPAPTRTHLIFHPLHNAFTVLSTEAKPDPGSETNSNEAGSNENQTVSLREPPSTARYPTVSCLASSPVHVRQNAHYISAHPRGCEGLHSGVFQLPSSVTMPDFPIDQKGDPLIQLSDTEWEHGVQAFPNEFINLTREEVRRNT